MNNALKITRDMVALEFRTDSAMSSGSFIDRIIPTLANNFKEFSTGFLNTTFGAVQLTSDQRRFVKMINKHKYIDLAPITVFKPEGLDVLYKDYLDALEPIADYCTKIKEQLNRFNTYLSSLLSTRDALRSTDPGVQQFQILQEVRDHFNKELGKCFKQNSHDTEAQYSTMIERNVQWDDVFKTHTKIANVMDKISRKDLIKTSEQIAKTLTQLDTMRKRHELTGVSPEVIKLLAEGAYQLASDLEFFSISYYRIETMTTALNETMSRLTTLLEK